MMQEITFSQWLKSRRAMLDLTQQTLADQVSCSVETIYKIEAGQRRPSTQVARLLAEALNIPSPEMDLFVQFARAKAPTKIHRQHIETTPWRDAFIPKNNLPLQLTALIGREQHLAETMNRLRQDDLRLLTLVGPPGIGKTRFAIQLGNDALLDFPDGVFFVELAPILQAERMVLTIAQTLDISVIGHKKPIESLHSYLHERRLLLILDNFEQLLEAAALIHGLLVACPLVKIIITSREPLRIRGEHQHLVMPLALPQRVDDVNIGRLAQFAAIQLFVERAKAVQPNFALSSQNAGAVAAICARLDGLPLAIEIAAAQMSILQPDEILHHLSGRNLLESRGMSDSAPRQQSLSEAINWSVQFLDETEQAFFRRIGIFVDGCTLEAAQFVCQTQDDIMLLLSKLFSMSLIKREVISPSTSRYQMLQIIREFARQKLHSNNEWQSIQARHAAYFHAFALEHEEGVRSNGQIISLELVEREHNNLQAALDYFMASQGWQMGLELVGRLIEFWVYHNHILIGLHYSSTFLELTANEPSLEALRARAFNGAAMLSYFAGDFPSAGHYSESALLAAQRVNGARDIAWACISLGMRSGGMGEFKAAVDYFNQGLEAVKHIDTPWEIASLLNGLGEVARSQGEYDEAMTHYARALDAVTPLGNLWLSAHILDNIGHTAYSQGRYDMAKEYIQRSLEASIALGDERGIAMCLEKLAGIAIVQKELTFAAKLLGVAEALREVKNTPIEGMDAADYQQFVGQLHEQLAPNPLQRAWHEGRHSALAPILDQILAKG